MEYKIGMIFEGQVTGMQPYGAFIALGNEVQGLIHVSEIQDGYTKNIRSILKIGEQVRVQIIDIDEYSQKISLSLRTLQSHPTQMIHRKKKFFTNRNKKIGFQTLKQQLPRWVAETMQRLKMK